MTSWLCTDIVCVESTVDGRLFTVVLSFNISYGMLTDEIGFFFLNDTATTEIYTLSLHDALPI